jgi:hypothetical protein
MQEPVDVCHRVLDSSKTSIRRVDPTPATHSLYKSRDPNSPLVGFCVEKYDMVIVCRTGSQWVIVRQNTRRGVAML